MLKISNKYLVAGLLLAAGFAASCQKAPPPTPTKNCRTSSASSSASGGSYNLNAETQLDFKKDIFPILSSNKDDEVYKCTSCHSAYANEAHFSSKEKLDNIIAQVEGLKMPLNGDEMRKEQIEIIKKWRDQKFAAEVPSAEANPTSPSDGSQNVLDWEEDDEWEDDAKKKPETGCNSSSK